MQFDVIQTAALGVLALTSGSFLNEKIPFLKRICIPSPVTGGLLVSAVFLLVHSFFGTNFEFDGTLKDVCMVMFFTTAGLQCNFSILKSGGKTLLIMVLLVTVLIVMQNLVGIGLAGLMGENKLLGIAAGSVTMCGGHGTAAGFSNLLESKGLTGAASISMTAATFGLLSGALLGGPLGTHLITRFNLVPATENERSLQRIESLPLNQAPDQMRAIGIILVIAALGAMVSRWLSNIGLTTPVYFGALLVAILVRNGTELFPRCPKMDMEGVLSVGHVTLSLFLGMAMVSLRLWELAGIAVPLFTILVGQVLLIFLFTRFVAFNVLGRKYDAAMLVGGICGFGLGATPNALANMNAIAGKHGWTAMPFIIVPVVGAAFVDVINITVITIFLNQ